GRRKKLLGERKHSATVFRIGHQLVQRIEGHELDAGLGEDRLTANPRKRLGKHWLGARIAIMVWQGEHRLPRRNEDVVNAPRIDAHARCGDSTAANLAEAFE